MALLCESRTIVNDTSDIPKTNRGKATEPEAKHEVAGSRPHCSDRALQAEDGTMET
jgi:hypothetical protein